MAEHPHIARVHDLSVELTEQKVFIRTLIALTMEILRNPPPDTFLGRKTQEPFPREPLPDKVV
ncbi:hypothetical protein [Bradyrhizobium japonicum]|uniref:hypothetical protein n=1 Tax=Bradyrhizobium japonicum TaxID=375 RepID=UPI001BAC3659|nr:hypothetical protein [Bradyrhizobium japonicum]MBR0915443.1 hypothetical protein [Bradyrhizobium japonicum]